MSAAVPATADVAVVGGGILGLACAAELLRRRPGTRLVVLEKEPELAAHQTSHNSGVVHAGIYYAPGSLKARLCREGVGLLRTFCDEHGIPVREAGKLIVAAEPADLPRLAGLEDRAARNGVPGVRRLAAEEIAEVEPAAVGVAALHSPHTAIVDFAQVARALGADAEAAGAVVATGHEVTSVRPAGRRLLIGHAHGMLEAGAALFCAGAWSDRLAVGAGASPDPRIVPFRGQYLLVRPERSELVRGMIYPVPDPALPFLGVHLTRHIDGRLSIGPTALPVGALDAYRIRDVRPSDALRTLSWPGTLRMAARFPRAAREELRHALSRRAMAASAARYVPELRAEDLDGSFSGVRAQAVARDGGLVDDFVFSATERALHVRNAPSPAATSSLAIARHVIDRFEREVI
ncbi:MAG: (S)-2-hydroxyglutarate dehydrogenase [Solirubrobacteraceae bacterium]|nr:(S)-2-hydroxyglutarate dehydrogenase [Solirubrobacteraceae bacterium]